MTGTPPDYRLEPFGLQADEAPSRDLAELHGSLMAHSPVVLLGPRFMERFYYRLLPRMHLMVGAVAYVDGEPAGFIAATRDSDGFMGEAVRRHWAYLLWVLGSSVLMQPTRLGALWEALQIMRNRGTDVRGEAAGELLSFGVLPRFRASKFVRRTGLKISQDLMASALRQLGAQQVTVIRSLVDQDNLDVKLMYRSLGWELSASDVPGWRTPQVEFTWRAG